VLSERETASIIDQISLGGRVVGVENCRKEIVQLFFIHPPLSERVYSEAVYKTSYEEAIKEGLLTAEEAFELAQVRGIFTNLDKQKIEKLRLKIEAQHKVLEKTTRIPARRDRIVGIIKSLESEVSTLLQKRDSFLEFTAERRAQEEKYLYLLWRSTKKVEDNTLLWKTLDEFKNDKDIVFRKNSFVKYVEFYYGVSVSLIREVARSGIWRVRYVSATKTGADLFGRGIPEYTKDQLSLAYWSHYYQSIYEMMPEDRPDESLMEDDDALDAYMKSYFEEKSRDATAARAGNGSGTGKLSAWSHNSVIVTRSNPHYGDVQYSNPKQATKNTKSPNLSLKDTRKRKRHG
jgi:hypothetical protein